MIAKDREDLELKKKRANKAVMNIYKFIYYTGITIFGYYVLKDSPVLPPTLGGSGSFYN
jgi:hypothetical protein